MPSRKIIGHHFTVEGSGVFPFDMLRYDQCYPFDSESVAQLDPARPLREPRQVTLVKSVQYPPTEARWQSFGWRIITASAITERP